MKSLKDSLLLALVGVIIMAAVGYPLGIIPALAVVAFVAFRKVMTRVINIRQQRPTHAQPDNIWLRNAQRMKTPSHRHPTWLENIYYLIAMLIGCNVINIGFLVYGGIIPPLKAATAVCAIISLRGLVLLRLKLQ